MLNYVANISNNLVCNKFVSNKVVTNKELIGEGKNFIQELVNKGGTAKPPIEVPGGTVTTGTAGMSKGGKIALGIAAAVAVIGAGYALFKKSKAPSTKNATPNITYASKPTEGQAKNLSAVV